MAGGRRAPADAGADGGRQRRARPLQPAAVRAALLRAGVSLALVHAPGADAATGEEGKGEEEGGEGDGGGIRVIIINSYN